MAKRGSGSTAIVRAFPVRSPAPVIRIAAPRAPAKPKQRRRRSGSSGAITGKTLIGAGIGGAVLGFVEKTFPTLPTVPILGRAGTIALGAYFLSRHSGGASGIMRDVALAGSVIAGYQLGKNGVIAGDVEGEGDVSGIAAQV